MGIMISNSGLEERESHLHRLQCLTGIYFNDTDRMIGKDDFDVMWLQNGKTDEMLLSIFAMCLRFFQLVAINIYTGIDFT